MASPMQTPISVLPRFVAIKGDNGMYLALKPDGLLTFDAPEMSRLATHEVLYNLDEPAFIIRSQNKRFWSRDSGNWIRADREQVPSLTDKPARFKLATLESGKIAFQSASDDLYIKRYISGLNGYNALVRTPDAWSIVEVSDASEYAVSLPRYIFLKGDNGKYLHTYYESDIQWLKFHGNDPANLYGTTEVIHLLDGSLALYSPQTDRCWRNSTNWIWTDATRDAARDPDNTRCHFEPVKLGKSILALRNKFNGLYCKRLTDDWESSLNAGSSKTTDSTTHLIVTEAATGRYNFDVKYLLNLASTTAQTPVAVAFGSSTNQSSLMTDLVVTATVSNTVSRSYTFSNSFTFSQTVSTEFKAGLPFLAEGKIQVQIGFEQNFSNQWGETTEKGIQFQTQYTVKDVPPGATATVTVICSTAKMRIPFTYKSKETAPDGTDRPTEEFVDGIYEGVDAYKIEAVISDSKQSYVKPAAV